MTVTDIPNGVLRAIIGAYGLAAIALGAAAYCISGGHMG